MKCLKMAVLAGGILVCSMNVMGGELADCSKPLAPQDIPDGRSSSESEMIEAQQQVKAFVEDGQSFLECLQTEIDVLKGEVVDAVAQGSDDLTNEQKAAAGRHKALVELHNDVVGEMKAVANEFNQALRHYNDQAE